MRAGMSSAGGLQGLLSGGSQGGTSSTASQSTSSGQSQGEAQSTEATSGRFGSALASIGGSAGSLYSAGMGMVTKAGATAASVGIDEMNQTGVGDSSYYPDYQRGGQRFNPDQRDPQDGGGDKGPDDDPSGSPAPSVPMPAMPVGTSQNQNPGGMPSGAPGKASPGGGGGGGGAASAAAEVPPVV